MTFNLKFVSCFAWGCLLLLLPWLFASPCLAEELEPRRWSHLPINTNFVGSAYAYTEADIGFDPLLKIQDAEMELDTWVAKYIRTFSLFNKSARIGLLQAYQEGEWSGLLDGVPKTVRRSGWTDTLLRFAINLYGAPRHGRAKNMLPTGRHKRWKPSSAQHCLYNYRPVIIWTTN